VLESLHKPMTPICLGIDEAKIGGFYRGVITKRTGEHVRRYSEGALAAIGRYFNRMPDKDGVLVVVTDLWNTTGKWPAALPEGPRSWPTSSTSCAVACEGRRVHPQAYSEATARRQVNERDRQKLKDQRFLLLRRQSELNPHELALLKDIKDKYPLLAIAQQTKEGFFAVYGRTRIARRPRRRSRSGRRRWTSRWRAVVPTTRGRCDNGTATSSPYRSALHQCLHRVVQPPHQGVNRIGRATASPFSAPGCSTITSPKIEERVVVRKRVKVRVPSTNSAEATERFGFSDGSARTRPPPPSR